MTDKKKYSFTLKKKFTLYIVGFIMVFGTIFFVFTFRFQKNTIRSLFIQRNIALTKSYALAIQNQLAMGNDLALDDISQLYKKEDGIINAYVLNNENQYITHSNQDLLGKTHPLYKILPQGNKLNNYYLARNNEGVLLYIFYYPFNNSLVANLEVKYSAIDNLLFKFLSKLSFVFIILFLFAIYFGQRIATLLSKPIKELTKSVNIISEGNFEYKIPNSYNDEIGILTEAFNEMTIKIKKIQELNILKERIKREMEIASEIQQMLVPQEEIILPHYKCEYYYSPAVEIGGDYYDFFPMDDNRLGFVLADVSGKGIPAAIVMSMIKTIFSTLTKIKLSPTEILSLTNMLLRENIKRTIFIPTFYGILDAENHVLEFSMAGSEKAILFNRKTKKYKLLKTSGYPLGMQPDKEFRENLEMDRIEILENECLFIYTDGLTDIKQKQGDSFFELNGIINFLQNYDSGNQPLSQSLIEHINAFRGSKNQEDDITFIHLCRT